MIVIIDYGMGNLRSVQKAIESVGHAAEITADPDRVRHVMSLVRQMRGGREYDSSFGQRMRGQGPLAALLAQRFARARRRLGLAGLPPLDTSAFRVPPASGDQGQLF